MKAPLFWYQPKGFFSTLLRPLSWVYEKGGKILCFLTKPQRCPIPIISIGNIVSGGAGKTPTAIALAALLQKKEINVHFITRGYGGIVKGPIKIEPSHHKAPAVGDEPLLLAQHAPTWVAKERSLGVQKAIEEGAALIILDDGHQTWKLPKDIAFVVVDLFQGFGNECVIPAGPLREDLKEGLSRADALIAIGEGKVAFEKPTFRAQIIPQPLALSSNQVVAFCGLGFPQKFYASLEKLGLSPVATESFPDHYAYTAKDLLRLQALAHAHQASLVTTRKDWVKIPPSWQKYIYVLDINIQFEDPEGLYMFILNKIPALRKTA